MSDHKPRSYGYKTKMKWTKLSEGKLFSESRPDIEVVTPPEWGGREGCWTPEHLLVSSVEACIMTTFIWWLNRKEGEIISYDSEAFGKITLSKGGFRFTEVEVKPTIIVGTEEDADKARKSIDRAAKGCIISSSLNFKVDVQPTIEIKR
jgi:organic hydroperoxide reductase OsmC/OhrA